MQLHSQILPLLGNRSHLAVDYLYFSEYNYFYEYGKDLLGNQLEGHLLAIETMENVVRRAHAVANWENLIAYSRKKVRELGAIMLENNDVFDTFSLGKTPDIFKISDSKEFPDNGEFQDLDAAFLTDYWGAESRALQLKIQHSANLELASPVDLTLHSVLGGKWFTNEAIIQAECNQLKNRILELSHPYDILLNSIVIGNTYNEIAADLDVHPIWLRHHSLKTAWVLHEQIPVSPWPLLLVFTRIMD